MRPVNLIKSAARHWLTLIVSKMPVCQRAHRQEVRAPEFQHQDADQVPTRHAGLEKAEDREHDAGDGEHAVDHQKAPQPPVRAPGGVYGKPEKERGERHEGVPQQVQAEE